MNQSVARGPGHTEETEHTEHRAMLWLKQMDRPHSSIRVGILSLNFRIKVGGAIGFDSVHHPGLVHPPQSVCGKLPLLLTQINSGD